MPLDEHDLKKYAPMIEVDEHLSVGAKSTHQIISDATTSVKAPTVDHPSHYNQSSKIECIVALEECMTEAEFRGFLKGNVIKYLWRASLKGNRVDDSAKAAWYSDRLAKFEQKIYSDGVKQIS